MTDSVIKAWCTQMLTFTTYSQNLSQSAEDLNCCMSSDANAVHAYVQGKVTCRAAWPFQKGWQSLIFMTLPLIKRIQIQMNLNYYFWESGESWNTCRAAGSFSCKIWLLVLHHWSDLSRLLPLNVNSWRPSFGRISSIAMKTSGSMPYWKHTLAHRCVFNSSWKGRHTMVRMIAICPGFLSSASAKECSSLP